MHSKFFFVIDISMSTAVLSWGVICSIWKKKSEKECWNSIWIKKLNLQYNYLQYIIINISNNKAIFYYFYFLVNGYKCFSMHYYLYLSLGDPVAKRTRFSASDDVLSIQLTFSFLKCRLDRFWCTLWGYLAIYLFLSNIGLPQMYPSLPTLTHLMPAVRFRPSAHLICGRSPISHPWTPSDLYHV